MIYKNWTLAGPADQPQEVVEANTPQMNQQVEQQVEQQVCWICEVVIGAVKASQRQEPAFRVTFRCSQVCELFYRLRQQSGHPMLAGLKGLHLYKSGKFILFRNG